jgi:hypothetical protein
MSSFRNANRMDELERKVAELEKRLAQLEEKRGPGRPPKQEAA